MNEDTRRALQEIDRAFYDERADDFAATRTAPWPGWRIVLDTAVDHLGGRPRLSILDLGCGHGRFARFLEASGPRPYDYLGIDRSMPLIELAGLETSPRHRFELGDILAPSLWHRLAPAEGGHRFDLVVAFGVLHHIAGLEQRRRFVLQCRRVVAPRGLVALSFWQFSNEPRFQRKLLDATAIRELGIEPSELQTGDHLMAWGPTSTRRGSGPPAVRYCHHATVEEARDLVTGAGLTPIASYHADGRSGSTNYYLVAASEPGDPQGARSDAEADPVREPR